MEVFSIMGVAAFCIAACMIGLPAKVRRLEKKIRKMERKGEEGSIMSELFKQLEGTKCTIRLTSGAQLPCDCRILAVDEEWLKICVTDKKGNEATKLIRTEDVAEVTCL